MRSSGGSSTSVETRGQLDATISHLFLSLLFFTDFLGFEKKIEIDSLFFPFLIFLLLILKSHEKI